MTDVLKGAFDIHVHAAPDVMLRAGDLVAVFREASDAGMAGILFKDHCFPTHAAAFALNHSHTTDTRAFGALALNVTVGGINPLAVEAALKAGVDLIYFPTYSSAPHLEKIGRTHLPMPLPKGDFPGIGIRDARGATIPELGEVLSLIREYDAALGTGHLSPDETLLLVEAAARHGVRRIMVTHASEIVPGMTVDEQKRAVEMGAFIEHCFLAATDAVPGSIPIAEIVRQTQEIGAEHVILASDYGKASLGSPVAGFRKALEDAIRAGLSESEIDLVVRSNPRRLLVDRRP